MCSKLRYCIVQPMSVNSKTYSGGTKNPDLPIKSTENLNMTCRRCKRLVTSPTDVVLCLYIYNIFIESYMKSVHSTYCIVLYCIVL